MLQTKMYIKINFHIFRIARVEHIDSFEHLYSEYTGTLYRSSQGPFVNIKSLVVPNSRYIGDFLLYFLSTFSLSIELHNKLS
jgi:hypothetical protein